MKIQKLLLGAALVVLSAACQNQIENPVDKSDVSDVKLIPVTFNAETEETKTTLGENLSIVWEEGDQINVIDNSVLCEDYEAFDATSAGSTTGFSGLIGDDATIFYALYPYDEATQGSCSVDEECAMFATTLKDGQKARINGLPANTNIAYAKADDQKSFAFHNLCAVVKFTLTRSDIATIEIAPNGENAPSFAGAIDVTVDTDGAEIERSSTTTTKSLSIEPATGDAFAPGTYYVCALPGSYEGGITVTFMNSDADEAEITSTADLSLTSGKIRNLGTIDKNIEFPESTSFKQTYSYGSEGWSLTNYTDQGDYYQVPTGTDVTSSKATIAGIFAGKTITSDVIVTLNVGTYGSGGNPTASTFSLYADSACESAVTATQGGTLPSSKAYTDVTYTVSKANAATFVDDLVIKITKPGRTIRLNRITVEFKYIEANPVASLTVSGAPDKLTYHVGDVFETAGLVVKATYEDETEEIVTDDVQWTVTPSSIAAGTTSVSVVATYRSVASAAYEINGIEVATLSSISVKTAPTKVEYTEKQKFDPTGLVISMNYSDSSSEDVSYADHESEFSFNPSLETELATTDKKVTITYNSKSVDQTITVNAIPALTTIEGIFDAATTTETNQKIAFNNWIVSGSSTKNVFVTDGTNGFIIYTSEDHGFEVGDILSGTVTCPLVLFKGSAEIKNITTKDLTVTKGGVLTPKTIVSANLGGKNTGVVLTYTEMVYNSTSNTLSDGTNTFTPYTTLYDYGTLRNGQKYNVTGVYQQYDDKKEILPRSESEITPYVAPSYAIRISEDIVNGTVSASDESAQAGVTVTLTATPAAGYRFVSWDVKDDDNVAVSVTNNKFTMPAKPVTVSADFELIPVRSISFASCTNGSVSATTVEGAPVLPTGAELQEGTVLNIAATPAEGYQFKNWSITGATPSASTATTTITVGTSDITIGAEFEEKEDVTPITYNITFKDSGTDADGMAAKESKDELIAAGGEYISSISATKVYQAKLGYGVKLGSSSAKGSLTLNWDSSHAINPVKVILEIAMYDEKKNIKVSINDGSAVTLTPNTDFTSLEIEMDGNTALTSISVEGENASKNRFYLKSITVTNEE